MPDFAEESLSQACGLPAQYKARPSGAFSGEPNLQVLKDTISQDMFFVRYCLCNFERKDVSHMALWAGRFSKEIDAGVNAFNSSIAFDARMYRHDIQGSIAHATMLGDCGIISKEDSKTIIEGLTAILADLDSGKLEFDPNAEDIHMFVEAELTKRYGDVGKRLHTSRSRNDQVALDLRLYLRDEIKEIRGLVEKLCAVLVKLAEQHTETVLPGYTHLQ